MDEKIIAILGIVTQTLIVLEYTIWEIDVLRCMRISVACARKYWR